MKKIMLFAVAILALASCSNEADLNAPVSKQEITVNTAVGKSRGFIPGTKFLEAERTALHPAEGPLAEGTTPRKMWLSAYISEQQADDVDPENYFVGTEFKTTDQTEWHADPAVYWPLGATMDFLAYSATQQFEDKNVTWGANAAESLVLSVDGTHMEDDIVFASAYGKESKTAGADQLNLQFAHTQAWLDFVLTTEEEDEELITVEEFIVENAYNSGDLHITKGSASNAQAAWSFTHDSKKDIKLNTAKLTFGTSTAAETEYLDVLLPEQGETSFLIKYTFKDAPTKVLTYRYKPETAITWNMGEKYVYNITFTVNEIIVAPTVTEWGASTEVPVDAK